MKPVSYISHNDNRITSDGKNYAALANDVVSALGGKENIVAVIHCMTRLRFVLKDESLIDAARLKSISGVLGVVPTTTSVR
ncbi:MAG: PTS transporter subunit EIIB [Enterobacter hormaechei]